MSTPLTLEEEMRYIYAAIQHLQHDRSTLDIADELGVSRFMVGRMVKRARDEGLIEVIPRLSEPIDTALSNALASRYGLQSAVVCIPVANGEVHARTAIAGVAARLIAELINEDAIVGLGPGRTIVEMCSRMSNVPTCDLVQLTGAVAPEPMVDAQLIVQLSRIARGRVFPLHAPFLATDPESARVIIEQPGVKSALQRMDLLTTAVFTVGGWPKSSQLASALASMGELDPLLKLGVTAELGTTLLDTEGHEVSALADRMIGMTTEQLSRVPLKIALGGGEGKKHAVVAALKSGLVDILVTDIHTARAALDDH